MGRLDARHGTALSVPGAGPEPGFGVVSHHGLVADGTPGADGFGSASTFLDSGLEPGRPKTYCRPLFSHHAMASVRV